MLPDGEQAKANGSQFLVSCRDSEFDQYGDIQAFSVYPEVSLLSS